MEKSIKIVLAVLLFSCLANFPYGYFQLVRTFGLIGFTILSFQAYKQAKQLEMIVYVSLAVLFQPLFKISLGREIWNIVDIIVGIGLILSIYMNKHQTKD